MGKLIEAVRKLGSKLTGKSTVASNSLTKVINDIAEDYEAPTDTQADWNEDDNTSPAYIKNKPTIPTVPHLYEHNIEIYNSGSKIYARFTILNNTPDKFTLENIVTRMYDEHYGYRVATGRLDEGPGRPYAESVDFVNQSITEKAYVYNVVAVYSDGDDFYLLYSDLQKKEYGNVVTDTSFDDFNKVNDYVRQLL